MAVKRGGWAALAVCALLAGCEPPCPCPEGYRSVRAVCEPVDAGTLPQCEPTGDYEGFGTECTHEDDPVCQCPAPVCAMDLGGYCTQLNCLDDPAVCPPDWTCFDLRGVPGVPPEVDSICMQ